jgi:metal-responsive CopG/Arc/MetJ family transcriptional regulator
MDKDIFSSIEVEPRQVITFNLEMSLIAMLDRLARKHKKSRSEILNLLIKDYFNEPKETGK